MTRIMMSYRRTRQLMCATLTICLWHTLIVCLIDGATAHQNGRTSARYRAGVQARSDVDVKDKILELQCYARCEGALAQKYAIAHNYAVDAHDCRERCKMEIVKMPRIGTCPPSHNSMPLHRLVCLDNCSYDYDCPDVQKCCEFACGAVCTNPLLYDGDDDLLPPIPKILQYKLPRGHKVEITIESSANSTYYYHVEVRSHIGVLYSKRKLGMWQWQPVEKIAESSNLKTKRTDISFNLRPGRWYQVRVAAINALGFRGYSEPSSGFSLANHPKPPKAPADMKVAAVRFDGHHFNIRIVWCPAKSNLPIEKYKITWSLYVNIKDESFVSSEAYVKDSHQFEIAKLPADSSYYIQVQAISISGSRRLKSEKFSMLFNTTMPATPYEYAPLKCGGNHPIRQPITDDSISFAGKTIGRNKTIETSFNSTANETSTYDVRFRLNKKYGMIVQISGFHPHKEKVYELCPKETNCAQREYSAIRAKRHSLEFSKLKFNTTYILKAFGTDVPITKNTTNSFTFTTPKCENFRKRFSKAQIKC